MSKMNPGIVILTYLSVLLIVCEAVELNRSIMSQCRLFRPKKLQQACYRIARNPNNIKMSGSVRKYRYKKDRFETENRFFDNNIQARVLTINNGVGKSLACSTSTKCRENLPNSVKKDNLRSSSPWDYCQHYDQYRFPQWINEAACLCQGCIDVNTRLHTYNGISEPVPVIVSVIYREKSVPSFDQCTPYNCYEKLIKVDVACHCYIPY